MPLLFGMAIIIFVIEIIAVALAAHFALRAIAISRGWKTLTVATIAVISAWLLPFEYWLDATLAAGTFQPWGPYWVLSAFMTVALPLAAALEWRP